MLKKFNKIINENQENINRLNDDNSKVIETLKNYYELKIKSLTIEKTAISKKCKEIKDSLDNEVRDKLTLLKYSKLSYSHLSTIINEITGQKSNFTQSDDLVINMSGDEGK